MRSASSASSRCGARASTRAKRSAARRRPKRAQVLEAAKADARATLDRAHAHIEEELKNAERQLDEMGRSLAAELAQRVLGRPLNGTQGGRVSN